MKRTICTLLFFAMIISFAAMVGCSNQWDKQPKDTNAIASVKNGEKITVVTSTDALSEAVDPSGNSQIKLWKDLAIKATLSLPYSCTLDFNGFTISAKAGVSNVLEVVDAGTETQITTLKNGTLDHYGTGIRVGKGGIVLDNMTAIGVSGDTIALADQSFDQFGVSTIRNSTMVSYGSSCIAFVQSGGNYSKSDITLENTTIVLHRPNGSSFFSKSDSSTVPATIIFGDQVELYSYAHTLAEEGYYYAGNMLPKSKKLQSVTVGEDTYADLNHWSTENEDNAINLLMIGNSFSYYYVQELYGMAHEAGIEINVANLYEAGCYMEEHWQWMTNELEGKDKYQFWITNSMGRWRHGQIRSSYEALDYTDWNVITLQQYLHTGLAATYEKAMDSCTPYTKDTFDLLKNEHPNAQLYWHAHWAFQVGHDSMPDKATQSARQNVIHQVAETICQENNVPVIPTGDAWAIVRNNTSVGDVLCKSDKYHDGDTGGGQYLNACVWFEVLTGKSCIGNTWRPNYLLSESTIAQLQQSAHQAVAAIYGPDYAK